MMDHRTTAEPEHRAVTPASEIAARWIAEAKRHEQAADAIHIKDRDYLAMCEEQMLHIEVARVLRNCARELTGV